MQIHTLLIILTDPAVTASMSSSIGCHRGFCFPASKAIDGIYVPVITAATLDYESVAHTGGQQSPYIQLDLGTNRCIRGVKIWNRSNDPTRKHQYFIFIPLVPDCKCECMQEWAELISYQILEDYRLDYIL